VGVWDRNREEKKRKEKRGKISGANPFFYSVVRAITLPGGDKMKKKEKKRECQVVYIPRVFGGELVIVEDPPSPPFQSPWEKHLYSKKK